MQACYRYPPSWLILSSVGSCGVFAFVLSFFLCVSAGYGMSWSPLQPGLLASGADDKCVCLYDVLAHPALQVYIGDGLVCNRATCLCCVCAAPYMSYIWQLMCESWMSRVMLQHPCRLRKSIRW